MRRTLLGTAIACVLLAGSALPYVLRQGPEPGPESFRFYRHDWQRGWLREDDAAKPNHADLGIALPRGTTLASGRIVESNHSVFGGEVWATKRPCGEVLAFYRSRYGSAPGLITHTDRGGSGVTVLDWADAHGLCTVVIEPAIAPFQGAWLRHSAEWIGLFGAPAEAARSKTVLGTIVQVARTGYPMPLPDGASLSAIGNGVKPRELGIVLPPHAVLYRSGAVAGSHDTIGVAEFAVDASAEEVYEFYHRQRPLWATAISGNGGRLSWGSGTIEGRPWEASNAAGNYAIDIRQASEGLPTIVRAFHRGPTAAEFIYRHSVVPWL